MSFSQALSGLNAASQNLDVIGNNIANSQTYGFKGSSIQFADVYAGSQVGQGVRVAGVLQNFANGTLETTGRNLDLGINGGGFFRFKQGDQVVYSRNGQLTLTQDGYLVNAAGAKLTGFAAGVGTGGTPEALHVPTDAMNANADHFGEGGAEPGRRLGSPSTAPPCRSTPPTPAPIRTRTPAPRTTRWACSTS